MSRYNDLESPDGQETNVGMGMVPEKKRASRAAEAVEDDLVSRLNEQQTRIWNNDHELRIARALLAEAAKALSSRPTIIEEFARDDGSFDIALNVKHKKCHAAADAFWTYWRADGDTGKHGYYESTWGAINAALRLVGVCAYNYPAALAPGGQNAAPQEETGWVVVRDVLGGGLSYFDGYEFSLDNLKALRFSRKEDADRYLALMHGGSNHQDRVEEHMWIGPRIAPPAPAEVAESAGEANECIDALHSIADELDEDGPLEGATYGNDLRLIARRLTSALRAAPSLPEKDK